ncbi:MAG TPA: NF038122 family metalloprotease [Tepidisphaeraceae bacterium]|jgi:hypothetical protein
MSFRWASFGLGIALLSSRALAIGSFDIHLNAGNTLQQHPDALAAFERAAQQWEERISSPIRININADMATSNSNVIGSTSYGSENLNLDYTLVRNAMAARASRPGDGILASLPTSAQVTANVPSTGTFDNTTIGLTRANQKALGLVANPLADTIIDGAITFNLNFSFDYDRGDSIGSGSMDFETVAAHEIGHVLGFVSDTDDYDADPTLLDNATTWDLFRFAKNDVPTNPLEFTTKPREMRPGVDAVFSDTISVFNVSTGAARGDGSQASHWKDDFYFDKITNSLTVGPLIGIMDPSLNYGTIEQITYPDLRVLELIGYDTTVPEPGVVSVIMSSLLLSRRWRKR